MTASEAVVVILSKSLSVTLLVLWLRTLPILCCLVTAKQLSVGTRAGGGAFALAFVALICSLVGWASALWAAIGYAYFLSCAVGLYYCASEYRSHVSGPLLFIACAGLFLFAPDYSFPAAATAVFLSLGWDLSLSGYSYWVDSGNKKASLSDCLFFLLVNPVLAFPERGKYRAECVGLSVAGLKRGASGVALLLVGVLGIKFADVQWQLPWMDSPAAGAVVAVASVVVWMLAIYASQAGLASVQIAALGVLGHAIPERFCSPLSATSPADFWRRWNTYVGGWIKRYVFFPLAVRWSRARSPVLRSLAKALALVVAFLAMGALHDLYRLVESHSLGLRWTASFLAFAMMIGAWELASESGRRMSGRSWPAAYGVAGRLCLFGALAAVGRAGF